MHVNYVVAICAAFLMCLVSGCRGASDLHGAVEITSETEADFHDFVFLISAAEKEADGSQVFRAAGRHEGHTVGLQVVLGTTWKQVSLGSDLPNTFQGFVEFRSVGVESDNLLEIMDRLYGTGLRPPGMKASTIFTAICLEGDPRDPGLGVVKIKLFFESETEPKAGPEAEEDDERYAELFTNIDVRAGKLYVNEKDQDYRKPVILALAKATGGG